MSTLLRQLSPLLKIARVTTAFAAVGNVWFVVLWTRAAAPHERVPEAWGDRPLALLLLGGAVTAVALFAYGTSLNDILDLRRDRAFHPDRPLPAGAMTLEVAVAVVTCTLLLAVLGATVFGTPGVILTLIVAAALFFYNAVAKFIPGFGFLLLGLIYAGHMLVPNVELRFLIPVWLVLTHALTVSCLTHVLARKTPRISRRAAMFVVGGWAFWTLVLVLLTLRRAGEDQGLWPSWVDPATLVWILGLALGFVAVVFRKVRSTGWGTRSADKVWRYGSLWLTLYACGWMFGQGYTNGGLILVGLAAAGFLGMTILREAYAMLDQPIGYRV